LRASIGSNYKFWQWRGASTITQQLAKNLYLLLVALAVPENHRSG
jgi:membrane peptidoglycan carboxypeptidase